MYRGREGSKMKHNDDALTHRREVCFFTLKIKEQKSKLR
jgi:hypothetical protein